MTGAVNELTDGMITLLEKPTFVTQIPEKGRTIRSLWGGWGPLLS